MDGGAYRGRHSTVFRVGDRAIKRFKPGLEVNFRKEVYFLEKLQPYGFVPRLYGYDDRNLEIEMEFIEGQYIRDIDMGSEEGRKIVERCFEICYTLDRLGIQKEEMHRPDRHIIVRNGKPYFIDFERAHETSKPSNVTQFAVYVAKRLGVDFDDIKEVLGKYKLTYAEKDFEEILRKLGFRTPRPTVKD
ncbi:hypothetical protein [Archaeoglobus veneficus]|uniref:Serine/threonine protein kinase n=1 Tax=Archaeoglobus veneficus (strain DSM 11195 / SNP6) TaxID=693661 RepID=F2KQR2_ARCVS|nr:hypothetical protein [Archaeoglobus veneficus]AEA46624.1 hypothetical protein Arcve_0603 [Archaeoglobus veneficus SNP6]